MSIIIPCYNAEAYIREAIESALRQTYRNHEVIVIDDGSTDDSLEVIKTFRGRIQWESGPNRGACAARNRGLAIARGELVQFLDADDLLMAEKLAVQAPVAARQPDCMICCNWVTSSIEGSEAPHHSQVPDPCGDAVIYALTHFLTISGPIHHRATLAAIGGFREHLTCCHDTDLQLRLACRGMRFDRVDKMLFHRRVRRRSVSSDYVKVLTQSPEVYWHAYRHLQSIGELTEQRARAFSARMASDARRLLKFGERAAARQNLADAYLMHASGGLNDAYRGASRLMQRILGPVFTELLVLAKRRLANW